MTDLPETPSVPEVPAEQPVTLPVRQAASKRNPVIIALIIGISIIVATILFIRSNRGTVSPQQVMITPTIAVSPTPPQNVSRISTTSAFAAFSEEVASFSAIINSFPLQDGTLTPPVLDTELEFTP